MRLVCHALVLLGMALSAGASAQLRGSERVEFLVAGANSQEQIFGHLFLPAVTGAAPVPAVVIVHGSGGIGEGREGFWGRELAAFGVAALVPDSFRPRGIITTADDQSRITTGQMIRDAFGALAFLSKHPRVDMKRVVVMGMSRGGSVALQAADERAKLDSGAFAAHLPLYPGCSTQYKNPRMRAPILMLIGASDDYTGVKPCAAYAERIRAQGGQVELKTYEGAQHGFDGEMASRRDIRLPNVQNFHDCTMLIEDSGAVVLANTGEAIDLNDPRKGIEILGRSCMRRGATIGFSPAARERAVEDVKTFLKTHVMK